MLENIEQALSWISPILAMFFDWAAGFVLDFFPDADTTVIDAVTSWTYIFQMPALDFNVLYFIDLPMVGVFMAVWSACILAGLIFVFVKWVINIVHNMMDSIPVIG